MKAAAIKYSYDKFLWKIYVIKRTDKNIYKLIFIHTFIHADFAYVIRLFLYISAYFKLRIVWWSTCLIIWDSEAIWITWKNWKNKFFPEKMVYGNLKIWKNV